MEYEKYFKWGIEAGKHSFFINDRSLWAVTEMLGRFYKTICWKRKTEETFFSPCSSLFPAMIIKNGANHTAHSNAILSLSPFIATGR
jgi:hypothetical protein